MTIPASCSTSARNADGVTGAADPAIAAATVVLLREIASGFEVLLLERHGATAFAGGAMVFPGGRVDPGDAAAGAGFAGLEPVDAAARVAAARETFEEADILLSTGPVLAAGIRADWRARLNAGSTGYAAFLAATAHRFDAAALIPFARWVPPAAAPIARRFDTRFYLTMLPPGEVAAADGHEAVDEHWLTPADALARADAGTISLVYPTRRNLERLGQYPDVATLLAATAARPLVRIQPEMVERDGATWLTIPEDCDYPVTAELLTAVRRE